MLVLATPEPGRKSIAHGASNVVTSLIWNGAGPDVVSALTEG